MVSEWETIDMGRKGMRGIKPDWRIRTRGATVITKMDGPTEEVAMYKIRLREEWYRARWKMIHHPGEALSAGREKLREAVIEVDGRK